MEQIKQRFEIQLPFSGFYYSIHDDQFIRELEEIAESWSQEFDCDIPDSIMNLFWDAADFANGRLEYVKAYASAFGDEFLDGDCEFTAIESPREYNFETDRIFATISRKTLAKIVRNTDPETFTRIAKERHSHRSGFISFYKPDWREWGRISTWDHNQLSTLLLAYLETERGEEWDSSMVEFELMESALCNGLIHCALWQGDKSNRAWKIYNYLTHDRAKRSVKTMAQWRIANVKPWHTTPLGQI